MEQAKFKARALDRAMFEARKRNTSCNSDEKRGGSDRLQQAPFNLSTEQRGREKVAK